MAKRRVRIKKMPLGGSMGSNQSLGKEVPRNSRVNQYGAPDMAIHSTLPPVPVEEANVEAERNEQIVTNLAGGPYGGDGIPETYNTGGKRHAQGGTPLNLPAESFIFSDTKSMIIKDPVILEEFGLTLQKKGKKGYTPAQIAKKYDVSKFKKILLDANSSKMQRETAEDMIANMTLKLSKLALVQEAMKGFPDDIPAIAAPYLQLAGVGPEMFMPPPPEQDFSQGEEDMSQNLEGQEEQAMMPMAARGGQNYYEHGGPFHERKLNRFIPKAQKGGGLPEDKDSYVLIDAKDMDEAALNDKLREVARNHPNKEIFVQDGNKYRKLKDIRRKFDIDEESSFNKALIKADRRDLAERYANLEDGINSGEYDDILNEIVARMDDSFKNKKYYYHDEANKNTKAVEELKKTYDVDTDPIKKNWLLLSKEDKLERAKEIFLNSEKQVYALRTLDQEELKKGNLDKSGNGQGRGQVRKLIQESFVDDDGNSIFEKGILDDEELILFQAVYKHMGELKNEKSKLWNDDLEITPVGLADAEEGSFGNQVSKVEGWDGNTVQGQWSRETDTPLLGDEFGIEKEKKEIEHEEPTPPINEFWLQDIIKTTGAWGDYNKINKYMPWSRDVDIHEPDVAFVDPARQIANINEQYGIAANQMRAYGSPQATRSGLSTMAGNAFEQAANVIGQYDNTNVQIANQHQAQVAAIRNQAEQSQFARDKTLYDETTIANQQFDNARAQGRQELRQSYIDAHTNRAKAYNLNFLNPQAQITPGTGGHFDSNAQRELANLGTADSEEEAAINRFNKIKDTMTQEDWDNYIKWRESQYRTNRGTRDTSGNDRRNTPNFPDWPEWGPSG